MAYIDTRNGGEVTKLSNGKFVRKGTKQPVAAAHVAAAPPAARAAYTPTQPTPAPAGQPAAAPATAPQPAAPATPPRPTTTPPVGANGGGAAPAVSQPAAAAPTHGGMPQWAKGVIAGAIAIAILAVVAVGGIAAYRMIPAASAAAPPAGAPAAAPAAAIRGANGMLQRVTILDPNGEPFSCWGVKPATRRVTQNGKTGMELYCPRP